MRTFLIGLGLMALTACGSGGGSDYDQAVMSEPAPAMEAFNDVMDVGATMSAQGRSKSPPIEPSSDANTGDPATEQYIAYSHSLGLSLPKGGVSPMMERHVAACRAAGTDTCIVINSDIFSREEDRASGTLSLRATPDWIDTFLSEVDTDTEAAGGEITQRSTRAEDLTRQIIDTGARLEAQKTLQGRLFGLLERRDGELGELLQIEREIARVTGEIESVEARLKTLRLRVSMSSLDVSYQTKVPAFSPSRDNPLGEAFADFFYNLSSAIAGVITAFAVGLPWILLLGLFLWIWLKLIWPRLRGNKKKPTPPAA
ncbi:MAG: DUF4349 domain-containing protein [Pseudomonadota bacterium]